MMTKKLTNLQSNRWLWTCCWGGEHCQLGRQREVLKSHQGMDQRIQKQHRPASQRLYSQLHHCRHKRSRWPILAAYGVRQPTNTWDVISETSVRTKAKQALRDAGKVRCARKQQQPTSYMMQGEAASTFRPQRSRSVDKTD
jgi:hypothetical protein